MFKPGPRRARDQDEISASNGKISTHDIISVREDKKPFQVDLRTDWTSAARNSGIADFNAYFVDGRFPLYRKGDPHLLGVEFVRYLLSKGVDPGHILFISSQQSMLERAVELNFPHVFAKQHSYDIPGVRHYSETIQTVRGMLSIPASIEVISSTARR